MTITAGAGASTAAARRRRLQEEEETMTPYTSEELNEGWEFKIARSNINSFRNPENLRKLIEEEALAGWVMVEKFDDMRVRFKRPASARAKDAMLPPGVDPYRTAYGMSSARITFLILGLVGAILLITFLFVIVVLSITLGK